MPDYIDGSIPGEGATELWARKIKGLERVVADAVSTLRAQLAGAASVANGVQPGDIKVSAVSGIPDGWLPLEGDEYLRADYPALSPILVPLPGCAGNGTTTFRTPDARGRTIVGAGTGVAMTSRAIAEKFGYEDHLLAQNETPLIMHNHSFAIRWGLGSSHNHQSNNDGTRTFPAEANQSAANLSVPAGLVDTAGPGSADPHSSMQPSMGFRMFIKT